MKDHIDDAYTETAMAAAQHTALVEIASEIGRIPFLPSWITARMAGRFSQAQDFREVTLGELVDICREAREQGNPDQPPRSDQLMLCPDVNCISREWCRHAKLHPRNHECETVCGADEPCCRCRPVNEKATTGGIS